MPRWFIKFLRTRRQNVFLNDFADAIDVMVRGLKSGLPVTDAMKIIAAEIAARQLARNSMKLSRASA